MADPLSLAPGQIVSPDDFFAVQHQHAPPGVVPIKSTQLIPITDPSIKQLVAEDGLDLTQTPVYDYHLHDGTTVRAITQNDGQIRVIAYTPSLTFQQAQAAQTRQESPQNQNEAALQAQRVKNAALPSEQDPRYETDAERATRAQATIDRQGKEAQTAQARQPTTITEPVTGHPGISVVKTTNPQTNQTETHYVSDATGQVVPTPVDAPKPTFIPDGHGGQIAVITKPDGTFTTQQVPGVSSPQQVTVNNTVYERGPDGVYKPAAGIPDPNAPLPPGAPEVDLSDPQKAYDSFMRLYQWGASQVNRGEKNADWLKNLIAGPHEALSAVLDREKEMTRRAENTQSNQLSQRNQDIGFADNRLSNATQGLQTATSAADKINSLAGPGLHAYSSTLLGTLALQGLQNQALGGTNQLPASVIPGPVAGQPGAAMPGLPAGVPDAAAAQAEAERQRAMAAQGAVAAPVIAGATATNAAATDPSGANLQAATDATMAGSAGLFNPQPPTGLAPPVAPQSSILPNTGPAPLLAMLGSRLGGDPLAAAKDALRRMGISEDDLMAGHQSFLSGSA